jgi:DNA-binding transcriptional ArsR family regulator
MSQDVGEFLFLANIELIPLTNFSYYVTIWLHNMNPASYHAISDHTRRQILDLLQKESLTAGVIAQRFTKISRPAVSKHLAVLRRSKLVLIRKQGRERIYTLNAAPLKEISDWVNRYQTFWDEQLQSFKNYVESDPKQEVNHDEES